MLVGIGALGRITGSMAAHFVRADASLTPHVEHLDAILDCWDTVTGDQL